MVIWSCTRSIHSGKNSCLARIWAGEPVALGRSLTPVLGGKTWKNQNPFHLHLKLSCKCEEGLRMIILFFSYAFQFKLYCVMKETKMTHNTLSESVDYKRFNKDLGQRSGKTFFLSPLQMLSLPIPFSGPLSAACRAHLHRTELPGKSLPPKAMLSKVCPWDSTAIAPRVQSDSSQYHILSSSLSINQNLYFSPWLSRCFFVFLCFHASSQAPSLQHTSKWKLCGCGLMPCFSPHVPNTHWHGSRCCRQRPISIYHLKWQKYSTETAEFS